MAYVCTWTVFVTTREQGLYVYVNRACVNRACVHTIESCPVECSLPCPVSFSSSVKCPESLDVVRPWAAHRCSIRIEYRYTGCNINTGFVYPSFSIYRYRCFLLYKILSLPENLNIRRIDVQMRLKPKESFYYSDSFHTSRTWLLLFLWLRLPPPYTPCKARGFHQFPGDVRGVRLFYRTASVTANRSKCFWHQISMRSI